MVATKFNKTMEEYMIRKEIFVTDEAPVQLSMDDDNYIVLIYEYNYNTGKCKEKIVHKSSKQKFDMDEMIYKTIDYANHIIRCLKKGMILEI